MLTRIKPEVNQAASAELKGNHLQERWSCLLDKITILESFDDAYTLIQAACVEKGRPVIVSFINAHGFNLCISSPSFYESILESDFVFRDGIGVKILFRMVKKNAGENLNGTDLIPYLLERLPGKQIALIGTTKPVLNKAVEHPSLENHEVVLSEHGFLQVEDYVDLVAATKPELVLLGMGMPKQEMLSALLKQKMANTEIIINGGAIIDFMGKKVRRAPRIIRTLGLEWMFRLLLEPRRLFKRYVIGNVIFLRHALLFCKTYK